MTKAQIEVISIILIVGIVFALIGSAYYWGVPLIEKRTTITEASVVENFIVSLDDKIVEIANSGGGEASIDIPDGFMQVIPYNYSGADNNSVVFDFFVQRQMVFPGTKVYVDTNDISEVGTFGDSQPRIITLESVPEFTGYKLIMRMRYRELDTNTTRKGFIIALNHGKAIDTGNKQVTISFGRSQSVPLAAKNGGDLIITHVNLVVS